MTSMAEAKRSIDELVTKLDEEIHQVKNNPFSLTLSSTANTALIQGFILENPFAEIEQMRLRLLGKSGVISSGFADLSQYPIEKRKVLGAQRKELLQVIEQPLQARQAQAHDQQVDQQLATETVDVTLPVREAPTEAGRVHPISQVVDELTAIFADMGFAVAEGPDIET